MSDPDTQDYPQVGLTRRDFLFHVAMVSGYLVLVPRGVAQFASSGDSLGGSTGYLNQTDFWNDYFGSFGSQIDATDIAKELACSALKGVNDTLSLASASSTMEMLETLGVPQATDGIGVISAGVALTVAGLAVGPFGAPVVVGGVVVSGLGAGQVVAAGAQGLGNLAGIPNDWGDEYADIMGTDLGLLTELILRARKIKVTSSIPGRKDLKEAQDSLNNLMDRMKCDTTHRDRPPDRSESADQSEDKPAPSKSPGPKAAPSPSEQRKGSAKKSEPKSQPQKMPSKNPSKSPKPSLPPQPPVKLPPLAGDDRGKDPFGGEKPGPGRDGDYNNGPRDTYPA